MKNRQGLIDKVGGLLHAESRRREPQPEPEPEPAREPEAPAGALAARIDHLEKVVEGLQDALYRHAQQLEERFEALDRKTEPEAIARELSADARRRGL